MQNPNSLMGRPADQANESPKQQNANPEQQVGTLLKEGVRLLYGNNFESMLKMFKQSGVEGFPNAMAIAINSTIEKLEKNQAIAPEVAAAVGMKLFFMLIEDIVTGGVLPQLEVDVIHQALGETIRAYAQSHKDTVTEQDMQALAQELAAKERAA